MQRLIVVEIVQASDLFPPFLQDIAQMWWGLGHLHWPLRPSWLDAMHEASFQLLPYLRWMGGGLAGEEEGGPYRSWEQGLHTIVISGKTLAG